MIARAVAAGKIVKYSDDFSELGSYNPVIPNMTQSSALLALLDEPVWFCLKAQPKREHLAAIALRRQFGGNTIQGINRHS